MPALGSDTDYVGVCLGELFDYLPRAVCRVVVDDDDIKEESTLLRQCALHCVAYSPDAVAYRDDDGSLDGEFAHVKVRRLILAGIDQCTDLSQMDGRSLFQLLLHLAVAWVNIVELLLATLAKVGLVFDI